MPFPVLNAHLSRALTERDYAEPTPVQLAVLEPEARGKDLLVSAQTGSGKTVAYGLAMSETLLEGAERLGAGFAPMALIIAPTRELAIQVHSELTWLYSHAGARIASCVGGMDIRREQRALADGPHIVVGTPGRLRDHIERGRFDTSGLKVVVLDEADEMLDLGFREDLEFILDTTPAERRTLLFSATIPREIAQLAQSYQRDAFRIEATAKGEAHGDIEYRAVRVQPNDIEHAVVNVLRYFEARVAMVFCATRDSVRHLHASLTERGFAAVALSGELSQNERSHALQAVRDGRARVCVATDVAARGIDVPDLGLVIHAELPNNRETLLHRSGRTGRAGRKGTCVLIVPHTRRRKAEQLLMGTRLNVVWSGAPTADEVRELDQQRLLADPALTEEATEEDLALGRNLLETMTAEQVAAAFIRLQRSRLPAPEELDSAPAAAPTPLNPRRGGGDGVWFRMNVGRANNADPRWLLPIICRLGQVSKPEIGAIRILDRETRFEIAPDSAARFAAALRQSKDPKIRIEPADQAPPPPRDRKPHRGKEAYDPAKKSYPQREHEAGKPLHKKPKKAKA